MTTDIAFGKREKTDENIRLAEKELDDNTLDLGKKAGCGRTKDSPVAKGRVVTG